MLNDLFPQSFVLFKRFNIRFDIGLNVFLMNLMYYRNTYYNVSNIREFGTSQLKVKISIPSIHGCIISKLFLI